MIDLVHDIINIADRYGLKIVNIDTTDVTLMARIEIFPNEMRWLLCKLMNPIQGLWPQ